MIPSNRRNFLTAVAAAATTGLASSANSAKANPSDRTTLCIVGVRGRGLGLAQEFAKLPNAQITHFCDINTSRFEPAVAAVSEFQKAKPQTAQDIRQVLQDGSIDAIVVATPDHWHALATIWGCQAGKHVVDFSDSYHLQNFLAAIQAQTPLNCDIQQGYCSTLLAHLGNLAYRVGRPLRFDSATQTIVGDSQANQLLKRLGRDRFVIPEQV